MISRSTIMGACALAIAGLSPALAQTTGGTSPTGSSQTGTMQSGTMPGGTMQGGTMQGGTMSGDTMQDGTSQGGMASTNGTAMTKSQARTMKRCQGLSPARMSRDRACTRLMQARPEMDASRVPM